MLSYHEKIWTYVIIAIFIQLFYTLSFAQTENIKGVKFKDGSIIYGRVIEMNVYDIRIETEDGKIISRKFDEVSKFIKDNSAVTKQEFKQSPVQRAFYKLKYKRYNLHRKAQKLREKLLYLMGQNYVW